MAKDDDKTLREKLLAVLQDEDDEPKRKGDNEETTIVLRGKDALRFLGIGDDEKKPDDDKPADDEKKPDDDTPKRGKGYFKEPKE